jgi:hypothetical protein
MNATFFGLAVLAALNPKLFGADLLIVENRRPRAMFMCFLAGGLLVSITIGVIDVLFVKASAVKTQGSISATFDLVLGVGLLVGGGLVATKRVGRRKTAVPASGAKKQSWSERVLGQPRLGLAFVAGAITGLPGGSYIVGLKQLVTSDSPAGAQVLGVVLFCLIMFSPMIVPFAFMELWPDATRIRLHAFSAWISRHGRAIIAGVAIAVGAYMVISGLVRVL